MMPRWRRSGGRRHHRLQRSRLPLRAIAGYVLDGEIGRGGMGIVYAATHPLIGKRVAIKILSRELGSDRVALERFLLEARSVNAIGHPNIVDTFDFGILPDGRQYLVMDLLIGETLRTRLRRGRLPIEEASIILDEVASALGAAHSKGIIHRDLKPDNVFVVVVPGRTPEIKLLDFGLVKLTTTSADGVERTRSGAIVGTPNYMSPEQARAKGRLDHRTDIYALGVLAFEMIAGELPYIRDNALDTLIAHVQDEIPTRTRSSITPHRARPARGGDDGEGTRRSPDDRRRPPGPPPDAAR